MKILVFAALLSVALGITVKVKDAKSETCAMLTVDGSLDIEAFKNGTSVGKTSLQFANAKLIESSNCTLIKLNMTKSAQVWFQFVAQDQNWQVTPISAFNPDVIFTAELPNDTVVFTSTPLEKQFKKTQSYVCQSSIAHKFSQPSVEADTFTYTVSATTKGLQIQSVNSDTFSKDHAQCSADPQPKPTTAAPTTAAPTTVAPKPGPTPKVQNFTCSSKNVTLLRVVGAFSLSITYLSKDAQGKDVNLTAMLPVPETHTFSGSCDPEAAVEFVVARFYDDWSITFLFNQSKSEYVLLNIVVSYNYDKLPNAVETGNNTEIIKGSELNIKASNKGYYTCNSNSSYTSENKTLTLYAKDFKFRAFDTKGDGFQGDVNQCSSDQDSNSVVPIAVGAALAGLVVIVLIAYLIGRKRSRKSGYESV